MKKVCVRESSNLVNAGTANIIVTCFLLADNFDSVTFE